MKLHFAENVSTNFSCDVRLNLAVQQQKKIFLYDRETMMKLAKDKRTVNDKFVL